MTEIGLNCQKKIFLVDPDIALLKKIGHFLAEEFPDYEITAMASFDQVLEELEEGFPSLIITYLVNDSGQQVLPILKKNFKKSRRVETPIILTGTRAQFQEGEIEWKEGDVHLVPKAIRLPFLKSVVETCLSHAKKIQIKEIFLEKNDFLFHEGEFSNSIFVLKKGRLQVLHEAHGREVPLGVIGEGQLVGEMSFLDGKARSATVRALEECLVHELYLGDVQSFFKAQPPWLELLIQTLLNRLREANRKLEMD